jgi:uncharacterized integral membrane protein (TIGR00697 family)
MSLPNEWIFFLHILASGSILLLAARLGRTALTVMVVVCTILMNITVMKQMTLFGLSVTGGNVLFATVFLANDVLNEHFGRRAARSAVYAGFASGLLVIVLMSFELWYAPNPAGGIEPDSAQPHMAYFFGFSSYARIVTASMISYLLSQLLDTQIYHLIRARTGTRRLLWLRSNASTWISQAFDTVFFTTVGLTGAYINNWNAWWQAVLFAYILKAGCAVLDTPFLYLTTWPALLPAGSQRGRT